LKLLFVPTEEGMPERRARRVSPMWRQRLEHGG
jgi:hypothetical protein